MRSNVRVRIAAAISLMTCASAATAFAAETFTATALAALEPVQPRIIEWRRDFHQNPELSNREFRTSKAVAEHLKKLGLQVETGVAKTGVVGILKGGKPGPTIALRADMDGLPVVERTDVPFRSKVTSTYRNETVGVMHACGHDAHTAILMGVAQAFAAVRAELPGTIVFLFQPAEEGAPEGEEGGAALMLKEGVFERHRPEAAFGLHIMSAMRTGEIGYRGGPMMAASDAYQIVVKGRQTHGSRPWGGIDPIVVSAQIVEALQTIVSRQIDITILPAVVTVGAIKGGIRNNIIPDDVEMIGTIRTFDQLQRADIIKRMKRTIDGIAAANGATATFKLDDRANPVVSNDPDLTRRMLPTLQRVVGTGNVKAIPLVTGAEDFAFFAQKVPSLFYVVGITPPEQNPVTAASNHSPEFYVDENGIPIAARSLISVAADYLSGAAPATALK
ncbi:MAG: amidohydrolase [Gammaproteobacteria bacterium]|jgi:amidohydrolase|nr:amidohydrolase [Gammaproteobacteria bacterium]NBX40507.1 amidohydrolase [Gammaproteobacteria bacterium]